jgi:sugar lactone lactonase YvrE
MRSRRSVLLAIAAATVVFPAAAPAYKAADGYVASDFATGFPVADCCGWGPIGVAFDRSDNLYVADAAQGHIYRFQPGGGEASAATRLTSAPIAGGPKALAITPDGSIYLTRYDRGDVVELDPATGRPTRVVVTGIACATGMAVDPLSGDLFVSQNSCGDKIWRVSNFASGPGTAQPYTAGLCCVDGVAFGSDGTLYAVNGGTLMKIEGTDRATPGAASSLAPAPEGDGVTVGRIAYGSEPFVTVNGLDGNVTRIDFSRTPPARSPLMTGGTRGDFAAVDSRGCLYVTQTDRIVRIVPQGRACDLAPTTPGPGPGAAGIVADVLSPAGRAGRTSCKRLKRVVMRVRQRGRVRLRSVKVYVRGKYRRTLRHRRVTQKIFIHRLPRGRFTVKLVARTTKGRRLTAKRRFRNC